MGSFNFDGYPPNSQWAKGAGPLASPAPSASIERSWHVFEHLIGNSLGRDCGSWGYGCDESADSLVSVSTSSSGRAAGRGWGVFSEQALLSANPVPQVRTVAQPAFRDSKPFEKFTLCYHSRSFLRLEISMSVDVIKAAQKLVEDK
jgi:hypothetical protein